MPQNFWNTISYAVYVAILIVTAYGSILFFWWWAKCRFKATAVYLYVMSLFIAKFYSMYITVQGYTLRTQDPIAFATYAESSATWSTRLVPLLIVLTCIVVHMTWRAFSLPNIISKIKKEDHK